MIPNQWYAILDSAEVADGRAIAATRLGVRIVAWRGMDGKVAVMRDACPHRGAALSGGRICEGAIQCPFHGFLFDPNGRLHAGPCQRQEWNTTEGSEGRYVPGAGEIRLHLRVVGRSA